MWNTAGPRLGEKGRLGPAVIWVRPSAPGGVTGRKRGRDGRGLVRGGACAADVAIKGRQQYVGGRLIGRVQPHPRLAVHPAPPPVPTDEGAKTATTPGAVVRLTPVVVVLMSLISPHD